MDYKNGKIYKIADIGYNKMYIGSTTQRLSKRFSVHKYHYKLWKENKYCKLSVFDIYEEFGFDNCKIELIENYSCTSKEELLKKEGEYIKNNICVNKVIAGRTKKQYCEDNKEKIKQKFKQKYQDNKDNIKQKYQDNKDKIIELKKVYYEDNKDKITNYNKSYYENNKNKIAEQKKTYRKANIDKIKERDKKYYKSKII